MMKPKLWISLTVLLGAALVLSACGAGGSPPLDATRQWFQALSNLDFDGVLKLTCSNPRVRDQVEAKLDPVINLKDTLASLKGQFDFSGLKFEEKNSDNRSATIHLTGQISLRALGQAEPLDIFEDIVVVNEGGDWKVCANPLDIK
jgi:hypothetical protein